MIDSNSHEWFPCQEREIWIYINRNDTQKGEDYMKTEAKFGVMKLQANHCQELLATTEARKKQGSFLSKAYRGGLLASKSMREFISSVLSNLFTAICCSSLLNLIQSCYARSFEYFFSFCKTLSNCSLFLI